MHTYTHAHVHACARACTHAHIHAHKHACPCACTCTHTHVHTCTRMCTYMHMCMHTCMHAHTYRDTHPRPRAGPQLCDFSLTWSRGPASEDCAEDRETVQRGRGPRRGALGPGRRAGQPPAHPPPPRQGASATWREGGSSRPGPQPRSVHAAPAPAAAPEPPTRSASGRKAHAGEAGIPHFNSDHGLTQRRAARRAPPC